MSLTSSSSLADVNAAFENNADYDIPPDVTKARAFIQAGRFLLRRMTAEVQHGGERIREAPENIRAMLTRAEGFLAVNDADSSSGGGARFFDFRNSR